MGSWLGGVGDAYSDFEEGLGRASQRQFDDEPGGGAFDLDTWVPGMDSEGSDADISDEAMETGILNAPADERNDGPVNQYIGALTRQFDDRQGGGFGDEFTNAATDAADSALRSNRAVQILVVLVVVVALGQLFDVQLGGTA
jgi:hypothetical protein